MSKNKQIISKPVESIWDKLYPDVTEAENLKLRSHILMEVVNTIKRKELSKKEISKLLGLDKERVKQLMTGMLGCFSLKDLTVILNKLGYRVIPAFEIIK